MRLEIRLVTVDCVNINDIKYFSCCCFNTVSSFKRYQNQVKSYMYNVINWKS